MYGRLNSVIHTMLNTQSAVHFVKTQNLITLKLETILKLHKYHFK